MYVRVCTVYIYVYRVSKCLLLKCVHLAVNIFLTLGEVSTQSCSAVAHFVTHSEIQSVNVRFHG